MLYDSRAEKWQQVAKVDAGAIAYQNSSHDGQWLFYRTTSPGRLVLRTRIADPHTEPVVDLTNILESGPLWIGLDQDDSVLLHRDRSLHEIYALTLQSSR